jgi:LmbE family N-acetylglucosaminyl deacetylase
MDTNKNGSLGSLQLDDKVSDVVLAVGAHPGDMEFMCGAMLINYTLNGLKCVILHMTDGSRGSLKLNIRDYAKQKRLEALKFGQKTGIEVKILDFEDGNLNNGPVEQSALAEKIREIRPGAIITHWKGSFHPDHRNTYSIVHKAALKAALPDGGKEHLVKLICYGENWEDHKDFYPQLYIDVTKAYSLWSEALNEMALARGEVGAFRYRQYYESLVRLRGAEGHCDYAQALMLEEHQIIPIFEKIPPFLKSYIY